MSIYNKLKLRHLLLIWLIINTLQAIFTPLHYDEAYYYLYSTKLDWGYFDHPPMVALFIKIGNLIFSKELGVRFISLITSSLTIFLTWKLIEDKEKNVSIFGILIFSMAMLNAYGFLSTPDNPLLFFGTLFLFFYKKFIEKESWTWAILLGIIGALLLYSKYHGILLIGFILLSNLQLLKNPKFYGSLFVGILLFIPHLNWQYEHQFPSIMYHLYGRSEVKPYQFSFTYTYPLNQLVVTSPFLIYFILKSVLKNEKNDKFHAALKTTFWGFLLFFFFMTFKGHVEPHWTAFSLIPGVILSTEYLSKASLNSLKAFRYFGIFGVVLVLLTRFLLTTKLGEKGGFADKTDWAKNITLAAQNQPIVFIDSYQKASQYAFYSGKDGHCLHSDNHRSSQFSIWENTDFYFKNKALMVCNDVFPSDSFEISNLPKAEVAYFSNPILIVNQFWYKQINLGKGKSKILLFNPLQKPIDLKKYGTFTLENGTTIFEDKKELKSGINEWDFSSSEAINKIIFQQKYFQNQRVPKHF